MNEDTGILHIDQTSASGATFMTDVLEGLGSHPKRLPCKYFYDENGCDLFDEICELDEYYLTRTEVGIMRRHAADMAARIGSNAVLIEFGSGAGIKIRLLLDHLRIPKAYVPVDIAAEYLRSTAASLAQDYPWLAISPLCADFTQPFEIPVSRDDGSRRVVYFPGSTIGNFEPSEARRLLRMINGIVGSDGGLLLGIDLKKDVSTLEAAYNDEEGVTAEFNLNILRRINRELDGDFDADGFQHRAVYDRETDRIEMRLVSQAHQQVTLGDETVDFKKGEAIVTEYSHKYSLDGFAKMAHSCGLTLERYWTDDEGLFAVLYLESKPRLDEANPRQIDV